jgi:hypothetical protein
MSKNISIEDATQNCRLLCRAFGAHFILKNIPTFRSGLPSNSSQNFLFCKLLLKLVTTPFLGWWAAINGRPFGPPTAEAMRHWARSLRSQA